MMETISTPVLMEEVFRMAQKVSDQVLQGGPETTIEPHSQE